MNYFIAFATFILLVYLLIFQFRTWRIRAFLSPAVSFAGSWILGVLGMIILVPTGYIYNGYPEYINELNIFVGFTAFCFILFTKFGRNKSYDEEITAKFTSWSIYKFLSFLFFAAALYDFGRLGFNLNIAAARDSVHEISASQNILVGYAKTLAMPLSIYAGYRLCEKLLLRESVSIFLFFPLIGNVIFSLNVGGRVDAFYSFMMYVMGSSLYLPIYVKLARFKRIIIYGATGITLFVGFINFVGRERQIAHNSEISVTEVYINKKSAILGSLYGPMSYSMATYTGYQARRTDAMSKELGYGKYTFNGFINWTIPFGSLLGLGDFSFAKGFGIYYSNLETYDATREYYYVTHSCYFLLMKDFGFWGSLIAIIFLTFIAQYFFAKLMFKKRLLYATSLYFFYLLWLYWSKSIFGETLTRSVLIPLYGFLVIDICNIIFGKKNTR